MKNGDKFNSLCQYHVGCRAAAVVPTRDLVGRLFTANPLLPPQSFISFTDAADVGSYFGLGSEEYFRALFYFSFISKNIAQAQSIQFARWVQTATAPMIFPLQANGSILATWTAISSGSFILTMGGVTNTLSALDFSGAGTLAAVAVIVQDAINAAGSFTLTGTTHGTTDVTAVTPNTSSLAVGMSVIAADIPFGTTIAAIVSSSEITLSQAATGSNVGETITFNNGVWGNALVTYSASYGGFLLVGGAVDVVTNPIAVVVGGGGTDITGKGLLGWLPEQTIVNGNLMPGAVWATGSAVETITQTLTNSVAASNNFGSFLFLTNLNITMQNMVDAATWNKTQNVLYMYTQAVIPANVVTWQAAVAGIGGTGLTVSPTLSFQLTGTLASGVNTITGLPLNAAITVGMPITGTDIPSGTTITSYNATTGNATMSNVASGTVTELITFYNLEFPEQFPMMIEAATNYYSVNSVQNYEFQQIFGLTPSVTDDSTANSYDLLAVNYYGATQQAGQLIAFYQQGVLQGLVSDIRDMNSYVNEIWLKDAAGAALLNLLLVVTQVPANNAGRNQVLAILQSVINQALTNGTISVGKTLTVAQQMFITSATGDPLAWYQVQNIGYWVDAVITSPSVGVFVVTYTLIYSKDDVIRKIIGTHTLI